MRQCICIALVGCLLEQFDRFLVIPVDSTPVTVHAAQIRHSRSMAQCSGLLSQLSSCPLVFGNSISSGQLASNCMQLFGILRRHRATMTLLREKNALRGTVSATQGEQSGS